MVGTTFNILRYTVDDGPGLRTTVFLKGCPLSCPWCSNPESQLADPEVSFRQAMCVGCGRCAALCPEHAIAIVKRKASIDRARCRRCMTCVEACLNEAMVLMGEQKSIEDVWKVVRRDRDYYEESGGGVTVSGGEPLMQADFVAALFRKLHEEGIHTCLDTTGFASADALERVLAHTDLVLFDLKHMDSGKHRDIVGVPTEPIHENFKRIVNAGVEIIVRIPYIPEFNDDDENMHATAEFVKSNAPSALVNILPYHEYGSNKYGSIGRVYPMPPTQKPSPEQLNHSRRIFAQFGLECQIRE